MKSKFFLHIITAMFIITLPACSNAKQSEPQALTIQKPVVAGMFYPDNPMLLKQVVGKFLAESQKLELQGSIVGLIAPHAGYRYSGSVAASAFKQIEGGDYKVVAVLAPSHRVPIDGAAILTKDIYETPLGRVPIATDIVRKILKKYPWAKENQGAFDVEHSLEVELPFLQMALKDFSIVPLIVGTHDKKTLDSIAAALKEELPQGSLVVASTDLSHYNQYDTAVEKDKKTLSHLESGDCEKLWAAEEKGDVSACGASTAYIAMKYLEELGGGSVKVVDYRNSGDTAGDKSKVVGYAAVALMAGPGIRDMGHGYENTKKDVLTEDQKKLLLKLAKDTVFAHVKGSRLPSTKTDDPMMKKNGAVFVTIKKNGNLRGCIGHIIATEPLIENVRNMAVSAASSDPRFPPVRPDELKDLSFEVSVLTEPKPVSDPMKINVGQDGLIVSRGFNRGVLLPQVPLELGWDRDEFLKAICEKAGMESECWKSSKLESFQAIVFGD